MTQKQYSKALMGLYHSGTMGNVKYISISLLRDIRDLEKSVFSIISCIDHVEKIESKEEKDKMISEIVKVLDEVGATQSLDIFKKILE